MSLKSMFSSLPVNSGRKYLVNCFLWRMEWMGLLLSLPWIAMAVFLLQRWLRKQDVSQRDSSWLMGCFGIKLMAAFVLQALYTYYYTDRSTADIFRFFDDGMILKDIVFSSPSDFFQILFGTYPEGAFRAEYFDQMNSWIKPYEQDFYNDNHTMIRYNAVIGFFSLGYYEVHSVITTSLSFYGLLLLAFALSKRDAWKLMVLFTVMPGVLIWTSGVLKESLAVLGIGLTCWSIVNDAGTFKQRLLAFGLGSLLLMLVKTYFLAAFIPAMLSFWLVRKTSLADRYLALTQWAVWLLTLAAGVGFIQLFGLDLMEAVSQKQNDFLNHAKVIDAGSMVSIDRLDGSLLSFLKIAPQALLNTFAEPFPWNIRSAPMVLLFLENLIFTMLVLLLLLKRVKAAKPSSALFLIQFAIPVILLIGYTTPVLGAIMRYRAPAMVLLVLFLCQYLPLNQLGSDKADSKN